MPLVVDKQERRDMVAQVAFRLVADLGIEAVTFRQIANETGYSTAIVSHYFKNKNDLLLTVYRMATDSAMDKVRAAFMAGRSLIDCVTEVIPATEESRRDWRVWLAFWGRTHSDPVYQEVSRIAANESLVLYSDMIRGRQAHERTLSKKEVEIRARRLLAIVAGISIEACQAPSDWTKRKMREVLAAEIAALTT